MLSATLGQGHGASDAGAACASDSALPNLSELASEGGILSLRELPESALPAASYGNPRPESLRVAGPADTTRPGFVPEPGSVALVGLGFLALSALRRRAHSRSNRD